MKQADLAALPQLAQDFLAGLARQNRADHTILEYASDLRLFFRYILGTRQSLPTDAWDALDLTQLDRAFFQQNSIRFSELSGYIDYLRLERKNKPATRARRFIAVKRFFRYLTVQRHILEYNPMDELDPQKTGKTLPLYLPLDDCVLLLKTVAFDLTNPFCKRDYCILVLFLNCGMRLSELCGLNLSDIRSDDTMRICGKGNKERTVYLNEACLAALRRYLSVRPQDGVRREDRDAVFISRNKRRLNQRSVELMLEKYLKACGLDGKGYTVHKLRHTAATLMYQNDVDVLQLKEILGHENLSTTQIYTHVLNSQLQEAVRKNPLSHVRAENLNLPPANEED
ncbi:MAG: tyrosine-type recombinase/integrase [Oscillospiraceae bacterium]|jgi:site-specific recombinase XerD|nr:tyrosine-type recombinase/integrase [Oscillospiraceae bacterium]